MDVVLNDIYLGAESVWGHADQHCGVSPGQNPVLPKTSREHYYEQS